MLKETPHEARFDLKQCSDVSGGSKAMEKPPYTPRRDFRTTTTEEEMTRQLDRCTADAVMKGGTGFGIGLLVSLLIMRRRMWPIVFGTGFGLGVAFKVCEMHLNKTDGTE